MNAEEKWHEAERLTREYCAAIKDLGPSCSCITAIADTSQQLVSARATQIQSFQDFQQMIFIQLRMLMDMTDVSEENVGDFLRQLADAITQPETATPTEGVQQTEHPGQPGDDLVLRFSNDIQELGPQYSGILAVSSSENLNDPEHVSAALNLVHPDALRQLIAGLLGTAAAGNHWDREDLIHFLADVRYMITKWLGRNLEGRPGEGPKE